MIEILTLLGYVAIFIGLPIALLTAIIEWLEQDDG